MAGFLKGVDISSLPEQLDTGDTFYTEDGLRTDPFELLKICGVNSVRVRIWNDPSAVPEAGGYCDLDHTLWMAERIKEKGLHFMLDFHYSDYWADPGQQNKPLAWKDLSFEDLKTAVHDFTYDTLKALEDRDCLPDIVQVGNEIRSGMLFPEGAVPNYENLAALLNEGIDACREISAESGHTLKVMIHLDQGGRFYYMKEWFDACYAAGMKSIDAIGISFYSFWHGTFMDLKDCMRQLIETYDLPVYVVETAHPWRLCPSGHVHGDIMKNAGLPAGIEEQKKSLSLIMRIAAETSGGRETGVYYWEPIGAPGRGHGSWAENMSMMDETGRALPAFSAYREFDPAGKASFPDTCASFDQYLESLYEVDRDLLPPPGTNLIPNGDFAEGLKGFWKEGCPGDITVECRPGEIYVAGKQNFVLKIFRDLYLEEPGDYNLSVEYRGTNTTGVRIHLFLKIVTCNGESEYAKEIFPQDLAFERYELPLKDLPRGTVQLGIRMETPPVFGRIRNLCLVRVSDET